MDPDSTRNGSQDSFYQTLSELQKSKKLTISPCTPPLKLTNDDEHQAPDLNFDRQLLVERTKLHGGNTEDMVAVQSVLGASLNTFLSTTNGPHPRLDLVFEYAALRFDLALHNVLTVRPHWVQRLYVTTDQK